MSGDSVFFDIQYETDGKNRKTDAERLQNYQEALLAVMNKEKEEKQWDKMKN